MYYIFKGYLPYRKAVFAAKDNVTLQSQKGDSSPQRGAYILTFFQLLFRGILRLRGSNDRVTV